MNLALFDLDYTLLAGDSDHAWGEFLVREGLIDAHDYKTRNDAFWAQYKAGILKIDEYLLFALSFIAGKSVEEVAPLHARYVEEAVKPMIRPNALGLVRKHDADLTCIVTATNEFLTAPSKALFDVDHLIACQVEIDNGRYTGRAFGVPSMGKGKITRVQQWLESRGQSFDSFERVYFYSDSLNDLPLLEAVSHPVAVNPDAVLREHARTQGWPILDLLK
ncbi:MAG: HAD family hydrolase [Betaproteobacteria bacterium]|nr:HAD family hydrolase [Betaproteobacteria bacterium]